VHSGCVLEEFKGGMRETNLINASICGFPGMGQSTSEGKGDDGGECPEYNDPDQGAT
jgi:hypothetical protein